MDDLRFSQYGLLAPRDEPYLLSLDDIRSQFGSANHSRRNIFQGFSAAVDNMLSSGVERIVVGGSFVSLKKHPRDADIAWWFNANINWQQLDDCFQQPHRRAARAKFLVDQKIDGLRECAYEMSHEYFLRSNTRMPADSQTVGIVLVTY
ncbi:DUF6932 family protein [Aurantivibrio plasticivorans]